MPTTISPRELRDDSADVLRRVEAGETFVITRNGVPVADLVPHRSAERRRFVPVDDVGAAFNELGSWGASEVGRERADLDARLDDSDVDAWESSERHP